MTVASQYLTDLEMILKAIYTETKLFSISIQNYRERYKSQDQKAGRLSQNERTFRSEV